ncbi:HEAT repeat domain-containing protein [Xanthomonas arboricola]|uniref:NACHT domain-containing protein n=1 Tax=Xanthomonas arboricola TaxID=56448 RepID=A0AAU9IAG5_9XANT|nr:HEAT repeat domain-containing protein [Xanthomonas arboricola]CAE6827947.1 hypothetical protein XA1314C_35050 [Xanthomonas arboricola]CAE6827966.1 hypothetical protein XA1314C_35050 [Xanthomonas arboricola]
MSGGRIAISGFDYQGIVVLDLLFDHFDQHGLDARVRPEGSDDVDLIWFENGADRHCHVQIKKPRETSAGVPKNAPWRLAEVANELLPNTLSQLVGTSSRQVWILGDGVQDEVERLVAAGTAAAVVEPALYWPVVHLLARAAVESDFRGAHRDELLRWRFVAHSADILDARNRLVAEYAQLLRGAGVESAVILRYQDRVEWSDQHLSDVLSRIEIRQAYGSAAEVGQRFRDRLQREYGLPANVVEDSLFGNLRSFVNDVSTDQSALIDRAGFEMQLRTAWPQMCAATEPPVPPANAIERPDLRDGLITSDAAKFTEVIGISGSGKTTLAAQAAAALADHEPERLPIYVRVRRDTTLRDVLSGVAFLLLRRGIPELFALAVRSRPADDTVIDQLGRLCGRLSRPVQLLLDLAEGSCNPQFGRDLTRFAYALEPCACRVAVFGQESSFTTLSPAELAGAGIAMVNMRGFTWMEFLRLVEQHHANVDKAALWDIFRRVTVNGPAGIPAQLADALAQQPSLEAMRLIVNRAPEDMVSAAEQNRFSQLPDSSRSAAERLVCFALPFRRQHAEAAFPNENVGSAITTLVALGLLRRDAEGLLEMHETIRAGLESAIAPNVRRSSHDALAQLYAQQNDIAAQIFHLGKAGRIDEADRLGRETFLQGKSWRSLAAYVVRRSLVSVEEIINVVARPELIDDFYLLPNVVQAQPGDGADRLFMDLLIQQRDRYFADYKWAERVVEVILALNPSRFEELLAFTVTKAANADARRQAVTWLLIASRRQRQLATPEIITFIRAQAPDVQRQLLPLLLKDGRRDALRLAFEFYARPVEVAARRQDIMNSTKLLVGRREDVVEILAALPARPAAQVVALGSLGFGSLGTLLWMARHQLRYFCVEILASEDEEVSIRAMAWRVLLFVGHPELGSLVDPLSPASIPMSDALLGPVFASEAYDADRFEEHLLDSSASASSRLGALIVLCELGADLGLLRSRLSALPQDPYAGFWDTSLLMLFAKQPFAAGVPLLQSEIATQSGSSLPAALAATCLTKVAEAAWPEVTNLLLHGVQHSDPVIRRASAWGLARRRAANATVALRARLDVEMDPVVARLLVQALAASRPATAGELAAPRASDDTIRWQCLTAGRTRDGGFAPQLVALAIDTTVCWTVRRAAIWSAGRLPFDSALAQIAPEVLAEHSPMVLGQEEYLEIFPTLVEVLRTGVVTLVPAGEAYFTDTVIKILERWRSESQFRDRLPPSDEAARWLYASLASDATSVGMSRLLNTLHLPLLHAATVRALGFCGRRIEIESILRNTQSVWLATKCMIALHAIAGNDPDFGPRLRHILSTARSGGAASLGRIAGQLTFRPNQRDAPMGASTVTSTPVLAPNPLLGYAEAMRALRGTPRLFDPSRPVALAPLSREELQRLIAMADPANDPTTFTERFTAGMVFTESGHVVGQRSSTSNNTVSIPERLRPVIVAANRYALRIPWHSDRLQGPWGDSYAVHFLASLGLQGDADHFYEALEADPDVLLPALSKPAGIAAAGGMVDDRLAPTLRRCLSLGDESFFESLCILAGKLSRTAAVPVLTGLLRRWVSSFVSETPDLQADKDEMWRGFARLSEHSSFRDIADWRKSLEGVLDTRIDFYRKQSITRTLEVDPGSYLVVEKQLAQEVDWVHYRRSEIDMLDEAAERLFHQTR